MDYFPPSLPTNGISRYVSVTVSNTSSNPGLVHMSTTNLSQILQFLRLHSAAVLNVYLVGSRLWGTHTYASDFDLLIVADHLPPKALKSQHKNQFDITLLTKADFAERVREGSLIETVCCLMNSNEDCVWREGQSMRHMVKGIGPLEAWIVARHAIDREKAKKFWSKGVQGKAYKILQHMITAESVLRVLKDKENGTLEGLSLSMEELHGAVQSGQNDSDKDWMSQTWAAVEIAHTKRLQEESTKL